jgi:hypothetical protein
MSTENNIPIIVSERISPDLSKAAIREIVAHTIDDGTPRDMSCDNDNNPSICQMEEATVPFRVGVNKENCPLKNSCGTCHRTC